MRIIPVDMAALSTPKFLSSTPKITDRASGTQKVNAANIPVWSVQVMFLNPDNGMAEIEVLNIPSPSAPDFEPLSEVEIHGMTARFWEMGGRSGISISAERVTADVS